MTEPTEADRESARVLTTYGTGDVAQAEIAAALAAAREEGRAEIRAKVEALADEWDAARSPIKEPYLIATVEAAAEARAAVAP